jgi:hypothetical protein
MHKKYCYVLNQKVSASNTPRRLQMLCGPNTLTATGHSFTQKGHTPITSNKGTSLHDVLYKRRKASQTNYRKRGDVASVFTKKQRRK